MQKRYFSWKILTMKGTSVWLCNNNRRFESNCSFLNTYNPNYGLGHRLGINIANLTFNFLAKEIKLPRVPRWCLHWCTLSPCILKIRVFLLPHFQVLQDPNHLLKSRALFLTILYNLLALADLFTSFNLSLSFRT